MPTEGPLVSLLVVAEEDDDDDEEEEESVTTVTMVVDEPDAERGVLGVEKHSTTISCGDSQNTISKALISRKNRDN